MAVTPSNMLALGTSLPDATLPSPDDQMISLRACGGEHGLLLMFICNHCPFVLHIADALAELDKKLDELGIHVVAINSNDPIQYPADAPEKMAEFKQKYSLSFPYLFDASQEVAKAFDAACTPDFFLFDAQNKLHYRGQLDDSRPNNGIPVSGEGVIEAARNMAEGNSPLENQVPSIGCNIKWK